jgi:hypothetical protein
MSQVIFISHIHSGQAIAQALKDAIRGLFGDKVVRGMKEVGTQMGIKLEEANSLCVTLKL